MNVALRPSLNFISLCTGGGGLDLGLELAIPHARSVCLVEREAFAASHLVSAMQQGLLAQAPIWSDVTTFNGRPWRGLVDGLIGGIPCQPHSLAGKRLGEDDERDLWSDARRIIVQSGAWFVVIENVRGMLSSGGAERVRRDLHRLGYAVEGGLFTASEVGASHERERIFILAVADADRRQHTWRPTVGSETAGRWPHAQPARSGAGLPFGVGLADPNSQGLQVGQQPEIRRGHIRREGAAVGSRRDGVADTIGSGRRRKTNAGLEPSGVDGRGRSMDDAACGARELYARQRRSREGTRDIGRAGIFPPGPSDLRSWANILASAPELEPAFRRVADGLASRLDVARVDRLRMLGNGVVPLQAAYAIRTLAHRLASQGTARAGELVRMMEAA